MLNNDSLFYKTNRKAEQHFFSIRYIKELINPKIPTNDEAGHNNKDELYSN